ncbi:MAG: hypothetical protein LLG15_06360 [Betaproteobacteria bacterium]|nr:hypothetical protein [Betaproteobacteria bacterium]
MLVALVLMAAASFAAAAILPWALPLLPSAHIHLALAVGVMPLIFGAMVHFVPVLTRSTSPHTGIKIIPLMASVAGVLAVLSFAAANQLYYFAALLALTIAATFFGWIIPRASTPLTKPHPCLHWYLAAIFCLMLALTAVAAMFIWPEQRPALKRLHLHLNTLGFIGLTAIATLQVLLPTVVGRPDPLAAPRLRQSLKWALGGTLLTAIGAAWFHPLSWLGALLWMIPLLRLGKTWLTLYPAEIRRLSGAAPSLAAALAGFAAALIFGALHATGILKTTDTAHAFILAFLFPLVTGAASQLLPVWARPGPQTAWHTQVRQRLGFAGGLRGTLFVGGGLLLGVGWRGGWVLAMAALATFLLQLTYTAITMLNRDSAD